MNHQEDEGINVSSSALGVREVVLTIALWKKFILWFVLISTVLSILISLVLPKWYKSTATILPPKNQGLLAGASGLSSVLKEFSPLSASKLGGQSGGYNYLAVLKSRRIAEAVINHFDLKRAYDLDSNSTEDALKEFYKNYELEVADDGTITIIIYDKDRERGAQIANDICVLLNDISIEMGMGEARSARGFLEKRVNENRDSLHVAEERLKNFQEQNGMIFLSEEARSSTSALGDLYAKKVHMDVELAILKKSTSEMNPAYQQMSLEKKELEKKLSTFPGLGLESFRLYRDVLIQQKVMEFLVPMYEQARIDEYKDIPIALVLDPAVPAETKARPQRFFIVAATFLTSLMIAVISVLLIVRWRLFRVTNAVQYQEFRSAFRQKSVP